MKSSESLSTARHRFLRELESEASAARNCANGAAGVVSSPPPRVGDTPSFLSSIEWGIVHARRAYPQWKHALESLPWWPAVDSPWREVATYSVAALVSSMILAIVLWWYLPPEWLAIAALVLTLLSWGRLMRLFRHRPPTLLSTQTS
ncbi:transmembrane protein, putative [Bodo saltans]|uniref:Transmembrane protein, putative n=1 Tax=Bodo saltans TaxID=75058 RepID=A0A0S4JVB8_BODSA|nr:transmembrane protein, putative [Bodo saltans]|eukprot:CUG93074.1 transmembrane protein, putative [Bodo saltans]